MRVCRWKFFVIFAGVAMSVGGAIGRASGGDSDNARVPLAQTKTVAPQLKEDAARTSEIRVDAKTGVDVSPADQPTLEFVRKHQAELAVLLEFMREKQPANYQTAIRQISRSRQRIEGLFERDKELYAIELDLWKTNSQLRLLAARMSIAQSDVYENLLTELKKLVIEENKLTEVKLKLERSRAAARLQLLDTQLEKHTSQREDIITKAIKTWETRAEKQSPQSHKNPKNKSNAEVPSGSAIQG